MSEQFSISPRVIDLICSRICHDLISPVSAINNGIELINDTGEGMAGDAFSLISDSAAITASRLAVMRYAFGAATPGMDEVREVAHAYFADSKIQLVWPKSGLVPDLVTKPGFPKIVLNVVLTLAESIGSSGQITFETASPGKLVVTAMPKSGSIRTDIMAGLDTTSADTLDARTIQAYVCGLLARRFDYNLERDVKDNQLVFTIS